MHEWVQRKTRYPVDVDAVIFHREGKKAPARLIDLHDQGCKIQAHGEFRVAERVQIAIPRMGMIKAQIQWIVAEKAGAKFIIESDF